MTQNDVVRIRVLGVMASGIAATLLVVPLPGRESAEAAGVSSTTVVRGTAFPDPLTAQLSFAGCATLFGRTAETPQPRIGTGPGTPPAGQRSLGYDLVGGNAVGALFMRPSMAQTTTADLQVYAEGGSRGVAYAAYQEPADSGTVRVWVGRADLMAAAGGWQRVDATALSYAWTKLDLTTGAALASGPAATLGVPAFIAAHGGDGAGFYSLGFGCDGLPFSIDQFRVGAAGAVSTFDLEGLATTTSIGLGRDHVEAGETVRLTGAVRDQSGNRVPGATLLLEQRTAGDAAWRPVRVAGNGSAPVVVDAAGSDPVVEVTPEETTTYRFRFVSRPLAEGSESAGVTVTVGADQPDETANATQDRPGRQSSQAPAGSGDSGDQQAPVDPPTEQPSEQPTEQASTPTQEPTPSETPSQTPSEQPSKPADDPSPSETTKPKQPAAQPGASVTETSAP